VELLAAPGLAIVLAEPGAGKTGLLESVATRLGGRRVRASVVRPSQDIATLVVDAFDEVARIGDARVHDILHAISDSRPERVLLSSRSGEWEEARTRLVRDIFGIEPTVAYLVPLTGDEQRLLFEHFHPTRSFEAFHADLTRFDLHHLLGNPEFLRLFAGAYDEADGRLTSRDGVFTLAVENLARETNRDVVVKGTPARRQRIAWANEIFAKLLISGADGIAVGDVAENALHPQFETIGLNAEGPSSVLGTKLFRPGAAANQHEPVHRIVAEYGAARHLVGRIEDPSCRLTITQTLALVAPNGVVRDDLRGLLGWMAAVGPQTVQDAAIALDPYAVLSNGDPSRLTLASRTSLLGALAELNADDPYFRRSDRWRSFSASGFFTRDMVQSVRPILVRPDDGHLRGLLLELLIGSPAAAELRPELEAILLDEEAPVGPRLDALSCLLDDEAYEPVDVLGRLIGAGTADSLRLASEIFMKTREGAPYDLLRGALEAAVDLYPTSRAADRSRVIGERYFLRRLVRGLDADTTIRLLDDLTAGLSCTCGKERHNCHCRDGASKVVGLLLDNYFEKVTSSHDPDRVWEWVRNLHYHGQMGTRQSPAVAALQSDHSLRRALHDRALSRLTSRDEIFDVLFDVIGHYGHSGLCLREGDERCLIDQAYDTDNPALWGAFAAAHRYHAEAEVRGPDDLRRHCREQAQQKPALMREWARMNRARSRNWQEHRPRRFRFEAKRRRRERRVAEASIAFFHENRDLILRGGHAQWTCDVARAYLIQPDMLPEVTHGLFDPDVVLRRSLQTLGDRCPSVREVGEGGKRGWMQIFLAGAVAEFRAMGTLAAVAMKILKTILLDTGGYNGFAEGEHETFLAELRRRVVFSFSEAETYARDYLEPCLSGSSSWCDLHVIDREPALNHLRATLPLEWLRRFPDLQVQALETLFNMAARHGDRASLLALIRERCVALDQGPLPHRNEAQRPFWFLRDFWFAEAVNPDVWAYMERTPDTVFWLEARRERGGEGDEIWTTLSALKVERILRAYLPAWPVVPLPSSWGTGSPRGETAYRYLRDVVWQIGRDEPAVALPVVERLLSETMTAPLHDDLRSIRAGLRRRAALPSTRPGPAEVTASLDAGLPASVEQLRALVLEMLGDLQKDVQAGHNMVRDQFFDGGERLNEVRAMARVSAWLEPRLQQYDVHDVVEHQLEDRNRCDLTVTRMVSGQARMLVIEGKGQWHRDLFTAASTQLANRYSMHPDADEQGIFFVVWYGPREVVAGRTGHGCRSAAELRSTIEGHLPNELKGRIDVVVLDVSRS
jgi:hypothetical protein